jgi:hypothetical protein
MSVTFRDHVAAYLRAHPNEWVSAYVLMEIGGTLAFRTRVSECRRDLGMPITNQVVRDERGVATSWYRYAPTPEQRPLSQGGLFPQGVGL